ncbi:secretion system X translation initiation factor [Nitrosovibrio sp. Nv6]|uniref:secretion system X translation initiation factor n=1 Tax=Nitrosovibrio sp. Nv6 TaxID=1855340 RepID=UPI0008BBA136|nr:secretion system X translation initiation factor [Nitrosovibrio sp. Nv6]SEP10033.1 hypothetical protein SAMN05216316_1739 [Nitrosovibrio sp. Nv6]
MKRLGQGRTFWLGGALLATLLATQWVSGDDSGADWQQSVPEDRIPSKRMHIDTEENEAGQLHLERLERRKFSSQAGDIFSRQSWAPPPPSPPASMKPQPPSPPPLQFKYLGKVIDGSETRVFLALAQRNYIVKPGESINSQYRVDEISDENITFTYLPLNAKQMLSTASGTAGNTRPEWENTL